MDMLKFRKINIENERTDLSCFNSVLYTYTCVFCDSLRMLQAFLTKYDSILESGPLAKNGKNRSK